MARSAVLNRDELRVRVGDAVRALRLAEQVPTVSRVRAWLVGNYGSAGAQDILQVLVREVNAEIDAAGDGAEPVLAMPSEIEAMAVASVRSVWRKAAEAAVAQYDARMAAADRLIADSVTARELAERQFVDLERERDRLGLEVEAARNEIAALEARLAAAEVRLDEQRRQSDAMEQELRRQVAAATGSGLDAGEALRAMSSKIDVLLGQANVPARRRRIPKGGV